MNKSFLINLIGFPGTLFHWDTMVLDRWLWLRKRIPPTRNEETILDVGCGTGAFSIGAALRGYNPLGLTWDQRDQNMATQRARTCRAEKAKFEVMDVRLLDRAAELKERFNVVFCLENIEHILNDKKLMIDMAATLKPGGRLLLTTPYILYRPVAVGDRGPFLTKEEGWHVRKGYSAAMLKELCDQAGLVVERITFCSGFLSQKVTALLRSLSRIHPLLGWLVILPLRPLPILFDPLLTRISGWPSYSICLEAYKRRYD
jgi:SAM-dependent methyltransferase